MRARRTTASVAVLTLAAAGLSGCGRSTTVAQGFLQVATARTSVPPTGGEVVGRTFVTPHFSVSQRQGRRRRR